MTVDKPIDLQEVRVGKVLTGADGVRLHVAEAGDPKGPLVLLLHGFPESSAAWYRLMPELARDAYVVAPDLRGYGLSDCPAEVASYRIEHLVADVISLIDGLGSRSCMLVGHDWGGALAWATAIAHPQRIGRLVILNAPHPVAFARALAGDPAQQAASQYMNWLRRPGSEEALARDNFALLDRMLQSSSSKPWYSGDIRDAYHRAWARPGVLRGMVNWYRATPLAPPAPSAARAGFALPDAGRFIVHVPTLVIWGERDQALLPGLLDGLDGLVTDLRIDRLADASHWLVHEYPEAVIAAIARLARATP